MLLQKRDVVILNNLFLVKSYRSIIRNKLLILFSVLFVILSYIRVRAGFHTVDESAFFTGSLSVGHNLLNGNWAELIYPDKIGMNGPLVFYLNFIILSFFSFLLRMPYVFVLQCASIFSVFFAGLLLVNVAKEVYKDINIVSWKVLVLFLCLPSSIFFSGSVLHEPYLIILITLLYLFTFRCFLMKSLNNNSFVWLLIVASLLMWAKLITVPIVFAMFFSLWLFHKSARYIYGFVFSCIPAIGITIFSRIYFTAEHVDFILDLSIRSNLFSFVVDVFLLLGISTVCFVFISLKDTPRDSYVRKMFFIGLLIILPTILLKGYSMKFLFLLSPLIVLFIVPLINKINKFLFLLFLIISICFAYYIDDSFFINRISRDIRNAVEYSLSITDEKNIVLADTPINVGLLGKVVLGFNPRYIDVNPEGVSMVYYTRGIKVMDIRKGPALLLLWDSTFRESDFAYLDDYFVLLKQFGGVRVYGNKLVPLSNNNNDNFFSIRNHKFSVWDLVKFRNKPIFDLVKE